MLLNGHNTKDIATPKILKNKIQKESLSLNLMTHTNRQHLQSVADKAYAGLQMMGNIGLTKQGVLLANKKEKS